MMGKGAYAVVTESKRDISRLRGGFNDFGDMEWLGAVDPSQKGKRIMIHRWAKREKIKKDPK